MKRTTKPRAASCLWAVGALMLAHPAYAQDKEEQEKVQKPVTNREPDVEEIVTTPARDLNLKNTKIPAVLTEAEAAPYSLDGLRTCTQLKTEIERLDAALGPDIDLPAPARAKLSEGTIAKSLVGSIIPFRGIVRELTGANEQEKKLLSAIRAGFTRRGFLKGAGASRKCAYPASPATAKVIAEIEASKPVDK